MKNIGLILMMAVLLSACQSSYRPSSYPVDEISTHAKIAKLPTKLRLLQDIHQYTLDNGLEVIIKEDHRAPVVMTQIWYGVGSNDEPVGKGGLSHFLEHLMFKDTPRVSGEEFSRLISYYGGQNNAYTNSDVTVYHEILPANRYTLALELEANRMKNVLFKPEQIHSERQVVQEERRSRTDDNPMAKARERLFGFLYGDTPRSRPVIGSMADIENLSIEDLQDWYRQWYVPNNATLVIVGDVTAGEALGEIERYFGGIPKGDSLPLRQVRDFIHDDDMLGGAGGVVQRHIDIDENVQVPTLMLAWQAPTISSLRLLGRQNDESERELLALGLFRDVLSGASGRFAKNLIKTEKLNSVVASYHGTSYGDTFFMITATPKAGVSLDETKLLIVNELNNVMSLPIDKRELDRSVIATKTALVFALESVSEQASFLGQLKRSGIAFDEVQKELDVIATMTEDEVRRAAQKYLRDDRMYSVYIHSKEAH